MTSIYDVVRKPLVTEKSMGLKESLNKIVFEVRKDATKKGIQEAIEKIFNVKVKSVRTMNVKGKKRHLGRQQGKRPDWKKAIVTLNKGDKIEVLDQI